MHNFFILSDLPWTIIKAKTAAAAEMIFKIDHPGILIKHCIKMAN